MTYVILYIASIFCIWWIYRVGWLESIKKILSILIPSALIILFYVKTGQLLFKSPIVGVISIFPTAIFICRGSLPLVAEINNWIEKKAYNFVENQDVIEAEVISKEDA